MSRLEKKTQIVIFLVLFLTFAYFYQGGGANQNARLGQMRAVVEKGQLYYRGIRVSTHDTITRRGEVYPNKAPGMSLAGIGPYFLISRLKGVIINLSSEDFYHLFSCYLITVILAALPASFGGVVFFRFLGLFHRAIGPRLICTLALFLGTPAFAYSTVIYGHMISSVLSLISFYLLYKYLVHSPGARHGSWYIFLAGLSGGWAVVSEYPVLLIVGSLSVFAFCAGLYRKKRTAALFCLIPGLLMAAAGAFLCVQYKLASLLPFASTPMTVEACAARAGISAGLIYLAMFLPAGAAVLVFLSFILAGRSCRRFLWFVAGLLPPAAVLFSYNYLAFGDPFYLAYFDEQAAPHKAYQQGGVLGLTVHARDFLKAVYQSSFGSFRGFFHLSPFLVLIFPGFYYFVKRRSRRGLLITIWLLVLVYFLLNSIYPYWYGGKALGPRHAMEILPYLVFLAFFFIVRFPRISSLLVLVSIFFMLTATAVRPEEYARQPFRDLYFYSFFSGQLSINHEATFQTNSDISSSFNAFNLGEVAGLKGQLSLVPLYLIWLIGGIFMINYSQKDNDAGGSSVLGPAAGIGRKIVIGLLFAVLVVGVLNLIYQFQLRAYLEEMAGAGKFKVSSAQAPPSQVQIRTSPGHRLQIWEVRKAHSPGDILKVKLEHAAAGNEGGFYVVAFGDKNNDGKPDVELGRSPFLTARSAGDWSFWTVAAPEGKVFIGNTWNEGARVFFDRKGWGNRDFSSTMYYSSGGAPSLSTGPRSTNMAVEILENNEEGR